MAANFSNLIHEPRIFRYHNHQPNAPPIGSGHFQPETADDVRPPLLTLSSAPC